MREDIYGGLKNAMERGDSTEQAIQSFINAGYKESEVRETARFLGTSATSLTETNILPILSLAKIQQAKPFQKPAQNLQKELPAQQTISQTSFEVRHKPFRPNWIIIILSLILLLSMVAFTSSLLFKQQIAAYLSSAFK